MMTFLHVQIKLTIFFVIMDQSQILYRSQIFLPICSNFSIAAISQGFLPGFSSLPKFSISFSNILYKYFLGHSFIFLYSCCTFVCYGGQCTKPGKNFCYFEILSSSKYYLRSFICSSLVIPGLNSSNFCRSSLSVWLLDWEGFWEDCFINIIDLMLTDRPRRRYDDQNNTTGMQQTINFLRIIDQPLPRTRHRSESKQTSAIPSLTLPTTNKKRNANMQKFQYSKGIQFGEQKLGLFPQWLKSRNDFVEFMYNNYEKKVLALPKICEKPGSQRTSDELYFLSLYLSEFSIFQKLPSSISEIILHQMGVRYYKKGDVVHDEKKEVEFMGIVFLGELEYSVEGKKIKKGKNDIILNCCFYQKEFPTIIAMQELIIFTLEKSVYQLIKNKLGEDMNDRYKEDMSDLPKSDLFTELHIKDKRSRTFVGDLEIEFYFKDEVICQCGDQPEKFYILLIGEILRQNHIYIREHNKWPLPNGRWQIRAVYKTYQNESKLQKYQFFGDEELIGGTKLKSTYIAKDHCILLSMIKQKFNKNINSQDQKKLKKYRNEHMIVNYQDFQKDVRRRRRDTEYKKKIIHQAIDVSFMNRSTLPELERAKKKVDGFEKRMLNNLSDILG